MARLAQGRDTHLSSDEIVRAALAHFDASPQPLTVRALARRLHVAPSTIYHYFPAESEIVREAVRLVFVEATEDFLEVHANPLEDFSDPERFLVQTALCLRRAFARHHRIAPYLTSSPQSTAELAGLMALFGSALESLGVSGERAGEALFAYGHYVYGSILVSASSRVADEAFGEERRNDFSTYENRPEGSPVTARETAVAIDQALNSSGLNTDREEALFLAGLRLLLDGVRQSSHSVPWAPPA